MRIIETGARVRLKPDALPHHRKRKRHVVGRVTGVKHKRDGYDAWVRWDGEPKNDQYDTRFLEPVE